jgi:TonB family protein
MQVANWEDLGNGQTGQNNPQNPAQTNLARNAGRTPATGSNQRPAAGVASTYLPPKPTREVLPDLYLLGPGLVPKTAQVEVLVKLDSRGHVTDAHIVSGTKLKALTAGAVIKAARQWVFQPAMLNGRPIPSEHTIVFAFRPAPGG